MEIRKIKSTSSQLELEITGENETMLNPITQVLMRYDDVEYASILVDHPTSDKRRLYIRMKKGSSREPIAVLKEAIKEVRDELKDFREQFQKNKPT